MVNVLELKQVSKYFSNKEGRKIVFENISFSLAAGEMLSLQGVSGSGKTTLLNIIAGFNKPSFGAVKTNTNRLAYAFQDDRLLSTISAYENLRFVLSKEISEDKTNSRIEKWLSNFQLLEARNQSPEKLSGGMKRRLNLARSFIIGPELLLLDEPFAFQDEACTKLIREQIDEMQRSKTAAIIIATHSDWSSTLPPDLEAKCKKLLLA